MGKLQNKVGGIHFRVLMLVTGLIAMLMATQLLSHTAIEVRNQQNDRLSEALTLTNLVARNLESHFGQFQQSDVEGILSSVYVHENVKRVAVIDKQQAFYLDVESDGSEAEIETDIPEMIVALETGEIAHSISGNTITVAQPLFRDEKSIGSLSIRFDNPGVAAVAIPIMLSNMKFSVPILLLGVLLSTLLVRQITVPLKRLAESTASVSNGDLNCVVPIEGPPEIRQLGASFSAMLAKLKSNIEQVYELAYVDKITKLPNREYFREELNRSIRRSIRQDTIGALLFVDLDGFKKVNDTHGHDCGDELLEKFSERLTKVLRAEDVIAFKGGKPNVGLDDEDEATNSNQVLARLGGDEFTVLLSDLREATDAALVSQRIIDVVSQPFEVGDTEVRIGASIGIAI
ncbi:MAG: sensor domain-containing diguanylate cyclase, partial [Pseudomonadota bacterium]